MSSIWTVRRSATDVKLTGLCGGVAQHWGVDPVLVRVGCALLTLSGGVGLVLYLAGWLLIPVEGQDRAPVDDLFGSTRRRWPNHVWAALVVFACIAVLAVFGSVSPFGVGPALVLAVIWYFGFYRGRTPRHTPATPPPPAAPVLPPPAQFIPYPGPPTPFTEAAQAWRERVEAVQRSVPEPGRPAAYAWPAPPPPPQDPEVAARQAFLAAPDPVGLYTEPEADPTPLPTRRYGSRAAKRLRLVSLVVLGLVLGILGILDHQGVPVPTAGYLAAALLVVGLTLIVATWFGRTRGLIPVGILLAVAILATSNSPISRLDHWESTNLSYAQVAELPASGDSRDVGQLKVDLSPLKLTGDAVYRAHVDTGSLEVAVPAGVNVVLRYGVDVGVVRAYDVQVDGGTDLHAALSDPKVPDPGRPTLTLDLSVDQGQLEVQR